MPIHSMMGRISQSSSGSGHTLQRGGGTVTINSSGQIDISSAAGQWISIATNNDTYIAGATVHLQANAGFTRVAVTAAATTISNTLVVSGTGAHTFAGSIYLDGTFGINVNPAAGVTARIDSQAAGTSAVLFRNTASTATVPVVVVRLGGSPAAGGDAQQWQNSSASVLARITSAGLFGTIAANTQTTVGAAGAADALPAQPTGYMKIDVTGTTRVVPFYAES